MAALADTLSPSAPAPHVPEVEGQPGAKPPTHGQKTGIAWLSEKLNVHPYVTLHCIIMCALFSWVTLFLELAWLLSALVPPLFAYVSTKVGLWTAGFIAHCWGCSRTCDDRIPVLAALFFLVFTAIPAFFGVVAYFTEWYGVAGIMFALVAAEFAFVLAKGIRRFLQCLSCDQEDMESQTYSDWKDFGRKCVGFIIALAVMYAFNVISAIRVNSKSVIALQQNRALFLAGNRPCVLNEINAAREATNATSLMDITDAQFLMYVADPRRNHSLAIGWTALETQGRQLALFNPWDSFSFSVPEQFHSVAGVIETYVDKVDVVVVRKVSFLWGLLFGAWFVALASVVNTNKRMSAAVALDCLACLAGSLLIVAVGVWFWAPLRDAKHKLVDTYATLPIVGGGIGVVSAVIFGLLKKYGLTILGHILANAQPPAQD